MSIKIYDDTIEERVVPAVIQRPSFRVIIDRPLIKDDTIKIVTTVNDVVVGDTLEYKVDIAPEDGKSVVATVSLGLCDQKSANIPTVAEQAEREWVTKSPAEKIARKVSVEEKASNLKVK
jgi:hypothetical protein